MANLRSEPTPHFMLLCSIVINDDDEPDKMLTHSFGFFLLVFIPYTVIFIMVFVVLIFIIVIIIIIIFIIISVIISILSSTIERGQHSTCRRHSPPIGAGYLPFK